MKARLLLATALVVLGTVMRIVPHPWNLTPIGAVALFSGALAGADRCRRGGIGDALLHRHQLRDVDDQHDLPPNVFWSRGVLHRGNSVLRNDGPRRSPLCSDSVRDLRVGRAASAGVRTAMRRIVSLLPSATEIICALGCEGDLVGRSHEC